MLGIEVKPGKPYTHSSKNGRTRLRISQATLANGSATLKSLVQCNVGDKQPVLLCALLPTKTESLQLDLEFEEAEDVVFSVIGPRGVYLTGYYVGHNRQSNIQDESESYGEDIANSETQESNHNSDEDEYEDSFINDDEPEPLTPSPVSSSRDDDDDGEFLKKKRNGNGGRKRLKKTYHLIESDDDLSVPEIEDEDDFPISSICKNKKSQVSDEETDKETKGELDRVTKTNDDKLKSNGVHSGVLDSKEKVNVHLTDDKTKGKGDQPNMLEPSLAEVAPEGISKPKKKKQESTKEEKATDPTFVDQPSVQVPLIETKTKKKKKENTKKGTADKADDVGHTDPVEDKIHKAKVESDFMNHDVLAVKDNNKPDDTGVDRSFEELASAEVVPEKNSKPKKKRKGRSEVSTDGTDGNLLAGNKQEDDQQPIDKSSGIDSKQLSNGTQSEEKKVKKKRRKTSKTQEDEENTNMEVEKENKQSATEPEGNDEESNKKTLSNGLVIEELATGKSKGKVKVQYVVKLKENGQVIDSSGKSPHKFRLGDKEVMEGLNVGLDGMRVGDKRRLTIPPSMSSGYKGTGENVPPNSWLVYDVEVTGIH
ncbi:hypothetical protein OSB04_008425 [Centaurea solstitialis]|uniref:peptidylprolyl isomerase n=1 Tax=Centaurea solstitialis TaxID=347529 RepID=A0AA38TLR8_9ASTR|nr:hypothetical protein OSB04_008425 [Centaurea solstitialis]